MRLFSPKTEPKYYFFLHFLLSGKRTTNLTHDGPPITSGFSLIWASINFPSRNLLVLQTEVRNVGCKGANFTGANMSLMNATQTGFIDAQIVGAFLENAILVCANFKSSDIYKRAICQYGNLICKTTMPDGTIEGGLYWGSW